MINYNSNAVIGQTVSISETVPVPSPNAVQALKTYVDNTFATTATVSGLVNRLETLEKAQTPAPSKSPLWNYCAGYFSPSYKSAGQTLTDWDRVIKSATDNPRATIVFVINPNNGNDFTRTDIVDGVKRMKAVGIKVIGYVYLSNGNRPPAEVKDRVSRMKSYYGVDGIMFDESAFPDTDVARAYILDIAQYCKSLGLFVKCNPGTDIPNRFEDIVEIDCWSIIEGSFFPTVQQIVDASDTLVRTKRACTLHDVTTLDEAWVINVASKNVGMFYVVLKQPTGIGTYNALSPNWERQVQLAASVTA